MIPTKKLLSVLLVLLFGFNIFLLFFLCIHYKSWRNEQQQQQLSHSQRECETCQSNLTHLLTNLTPSNSETPVIIYPWNIHIQKRDVKELEGRQIPNIVFYVWCGNKTFEFRHYLSVLSVWYVFEPEVIEFMYEFPPQEDNYNSWFTLLRVHIPAFQSRPLPAYVRHQQGCGDTFGLELLYDRGGVYVITEAVLNALSARVLYHELSFAGSSLLQQLGYVASVKRIKVVQQVIEKMYNVKSGNQSGHLLSNLVHLSGVKASSCVTLDDDDNGTIVLLENSTCTLIRRPIFPKDLFASNSSMAVLWLQRIFYGHHNDNKDTFPFSSQDEKQGKELEPGKRNFEKSLDPFPSVVHYVWFGASEMTFGMYLSFLSSLYVVKPSTIFIHGDLLLSGPYWQLVKAHSKVCLIYHEKPTFIFGKRVLYRQHLSDVVRADLLDKYGGIYIDWDAYWLKSPADLQQDSYDIIVSRDHMPRPDFPNTINMGVVIARPRSQFIRAWRSALVSYRSQDFLYNAVELPYKIFEMFPSRIFVSDRLQVMCYFLKCHPTFHPDFRQWDRAQDFDWRKDAYAIHFTHPDPPSFDNETALHASTGMFADIGRYIWSFHTKTKQ